MERKQWKLNLKQIEKKGENVFHIWDKQLKLLWPKQSLDSGFKSAVVEQTVTQNHKKTLLNCAEGAYQLSQVYDRLIQSVTSSDDTQNLDRVVSFHWGR